MFFILEFGFRIISTVEKAAVCSGLLVPVIVVKTPFSVIQQNSA